MKHPRGRCPTCPYTFRLRRDGTVQTHHLYPGGPRAQRYACKGSGKPPRLKCPRCATSFTTDTPVTAPALCPACHAGETA